MRPLKKFRYVINMVLKFFNSFLKTLHLEIIAVRLIDDHSRYITLNSVFGALSKILDPIRVSLFSTNIFISKSLDADTYYCHTLIYLI